MKTGISALILAGLATLTGLAQADTYSTFITIDNLEVISDEFAIYTSGVPNGSPNNPANCSAGTGRYYVHSASTTPEQRELMAKTLLAAFLAGRKVELYVKSSGTPCYNNYPTYTFVRLSRTQ